MTRGMTDGGKKAHAWNGKALRGSKLAISTRQPIYLGLCDDCCQPLHSPARVIDGQPNRVVHAVCPQRAT